MINKGKKLAAGISLLSFMLGATALLRAQSAESKPPATTPQESGTQAPDHAQAYYHYMLARRFRELAGIYNRSEYVDRAIAEYKAAMAADPGSLFLRTELAELYWRISRVGDAISEAQAVLKINPDYADAHRLLGHIYLRSLGQGESDKGAADSLNKAIEQFEDLVKVDPSDTDSYVILGRLYKLNNQTDKAAEAFKKVLNTDPDSRDALVSLAQLYLDQGDYDDAIALLTNVPDDEMDASLFALLGTAYGQNHNVDKAIETFDKALTDEPDNVELRRAYAGILLDNNRSAAARAQLEKILQADPQDGSTLLRLGQLDRETGNFDKAREELERARTLLPDSSDAVSYQLAVLENTVGNDAKAIAIFQDLLKKSEKANGDYSPGEANNRALFLEQIGGIYRTEEKYDQAIETYKQILPLGKSQAPRAEGLIIETLRLKREPAEALKRTESAMKQYPDDRQLKMLHASLIGEQGQVDQAVAELKGLMNGSQTDRETLLVIAQIYSQAKRFPEAEDAVQKAIAASTQPDDQSRARFILGSIYEREKKYDLAEQEFKKVLAFDPLNGAAANYLGYMLADRGVRLDESVDYIEKALQTDPNNGAYLDSLGWAYYKMKRLDLAELNLEKAAKLTDDPTVHEHLGRVYLEEGKKKLAQKEWERALQQAPLNDSGDFDAAHAAQLRKELDKLKRTLAMDNSAKP